MANSQELSEKRQIQDKRDKVRIVSLVTKIFDFLSANYGFAWSRGLEYSTNEARINVWSDAVKGIEREQLAYAKQKILRGECYLDFPPTAAQFRVLCKSTPNDLLSKSMQNSNNPIKIIRLDPNYDKNWFKSLSDSHKEKVYEGAVMAYPALEHLLKSSNQSFLDDSFQKSIWLNPMIEAFREFYKIDSLIGFKIESLCTKD